MPDTPTIFGTIDVLAQPIPARREWYLVIGTFQGGWGAPRFLRGPKGSRTQAEQDVEWAREKGWANLRIVVIPGEEEAKA